MFILHFSSVFSAAMVGGKISCFLGLGNLHLRDPEDVSTDCREFYSF